ncbi:endolytic transglycosylase MltG [Anaerosalibacter bizertensis]|uniref:Endolytic murein transglycosylase n=1 Tax=Anaerosalibacter bizertensis TaxID=932217 RepID=A0A844FFN4_9FIRM|nr:endolytic transglycosylase MltG [Anaerosalibacter bizertensis]MCG4564201.1 endolytic transglycosylase MltG [Anaerosalibacter bizertensis]MSS42843.1 endolytic transglycosylase MltG [Anaerosalibacter bizertensis]
MSKYIKGGDFVAESLKNKNRKKNTNKRLIIYSIIIILCLVTMKIFYDKASGPVSLYNPKDIDIEIPSGSSTTKIANILKENGLINNKLVFKCKVKIEKLDGKLKAGNYIFSTGMNLDEILSKLSSGGKDGNVVKVTIPEGFELKQIAYRLDELGLVDEKKFLEVSKDISKFSDKYTFLNTIPKDYNLEGYLFPDTYEIDINASEEEIIEIMLSRFEQFYESDLKNKAEKSGLDLNKIITLASIVEREARVDKERSIIAGVIYNRLKIDMPLQVDATVQYALGERKERLLYKDLKIESPYNTYLHKGLPPAPIASPGAKSLIAAVNPSDVDYLYYVLKNDGSGEHIFTKTYEEHLEAQSKK